MGTTRDAIRGSNPELAFVLCIEGYKYLLTDGSTSAAETAWAGTLWSDALTGLRVSGDLEQSIKPWSNEPSVQSLTFSIIGDNDTDQFATDVFKTKPTNRSELTLSFDTADSDGGGFNINVKKATLFGAGDPVYIGGEAFHVTGTPAGTTIPVATNGEGYFAPFSGNTGSTNRFPQPHTIAGDRENINNFESNAPVWVSDSPTNWVGKKVGLWVHRVSNGVLDTKAEAELWFAGSISSVSEGEMSTDLECVGIQQSIIDAQILADQWTGRLKEGYVFDGDEVFRAYHMDESGATPAHYQSADFTTTGRLSPDELGSELAAFLDADSTVGAASTPDLRWSAGLIDTENGTRFHVTASRDGSTTDREGYVGISCSNRDALKFLGWDDAPHQHTDGSAMALSHRIDDYSWSVVSSDAPYRYPTLGTLGTGTWYAPGITEIELEDSDGTFFDQTSLMPSQVQELVDGDTWALYSLGGSVLFVGRRASATSITGISFNIGLPSISLTPEDNMQGLRIGDGRSLSVKQCLFITGSFSSIISKLFASIDGNSINHVDHDVFPFGAAIPWDLLGSGFVQSLEEVEQSTSEDSLSIIVEKPMRLWDVIKSDFALRMAAPIWKDGGIQIAQLTVPNASTADHTLDETNKGDARRTVPKMTSEFQTHTLKIEYNRNPLKDKYRDTHIVRDQTAYQNAGRAGKTKTIKARNSYAGVVATGASVESLGDMLGARFMPVLARPLGVWTRSINHQLFHMAPGDTCTLSDDRVRNPSTGQRGISSRACTVLSVSHSLGISSGGGQGYHGNVELLYTEEDRAGFPLCPSAEHVVATTTATGRNWTAGYDDEVGTGGVFSMLVYQNSYSETGEANDHTRFVAGDEIRVTEQDPADPASADSFTDTVASTAEGVALASSVDEIVLTDGFGNGGNPAFDSSKRYVINYASYTSVDTAQKLYAFQADDSDGEIQDTIDANTLGEQVRGVSLAAADTTALPSRHATQQYGDGVPFSASLLRDQSRMVNNLLDYKTAPHMPVVADGGGFTYASGGTATDMHVVWQFPYLVQGNWQAGLQRKLNVAAQFASTTGATATVRVTSSAMPTAYALDAFGLRVVSWGKTRRRSVSFTTTSTTTYTVATAQELSIIRAYADPMVTWITVEMDSLTDMSGIPELWLGPIQ